MSAPRAADVGHLVSGPAGRGVRWVAGGTDLETGVDCKYLAWLALKACGKDVPWHSLVGGDDLSDAAMEAFQRDQAELWRPAEEATELGDLVVSRQPGQDGCSDGGPHLSVLVDEGRRQVLTISRRAGAALLPVFALQGVEAVLRFHGGRQPAPVVR